MRGSYDRFVARLPRSVVIRDVLLGVAVTAVAEVELLALAPAQIEGPVLGHHLVNLLILPALALRRLTPLGSILVAALGFAVEPLMGSAPVATPYLALLFLLGSLGWYASLRTGVVGVGVTLAAGLVYDATTSDFRWADLIVNAVIILMVWAVVHLMRLTTDRRIRVELDAARSADDAVTAERERIARDLHDSMAHALTLITLQAGGARERADEPLVQETFGAIEQAGREALADMHRFLDLLGPDDDEAPGLAHLPDLVDGVRRGGLDVDLDVQVLADLPPSVATTVYRIVQEGLTNVVRHSDARHARVEVSSDGRAVMARVVDDGSAREALVAGSGHGIAGLRERLALFHGTLETGSNGSGWSMEGRIPIGSGP